ncbi:MAG: PVC-type heme-binding CxxCH protein [Limisphaerales bacterium]
MSSPAASHPVRVHAIALMLLPLLAMAQIPLPTDAPKPLTPAESAAAFHLPPDFRMQTVASEPLISSPSGVCWDARGRLFISELHGYNLEGQLDIEELNKTGQLDTQVRRVQADEKFKKAAEPGTYGVVKMLEDTDADGIMDRATIWSTNLPPVYGLVPARGGLILACAPHIIFLADPDDDGHPEIRETLFTGFETGPLERGINAPQWSPDGWIYFGSGAGGGTVTGPHLPSPVQLPRSDFRIRPDGTAIEPLTGSTGTFGFALTPTGDRFTMSTGEPGRFVAPLPWTYLSRNPNAKTTDRLEMPSGDKRVYPLAPAHPWRQKRADHPEYSKYYRDRYGAGDSDAGGWFTSACSPLIYLDHALPNLHGHYFACEPSGNILHRSLIQAQGPALTLHRHPNELQSEFAATSDAWSHPMNLSHGPDGSIWVVDYYREIIEDYSAIPRHLQQQYGVYNGHNRGRIYRLTHEQQPSPPPADLSRLSSSQLAKECASTYHWRRLTAQRLLVEGRHTSASSILHSLLESRPTNELATITILHTLNQLGTLTPDDIQAHLTHPHPAVRVHALQLADTRFDQSPTLLQATLTALDSDSNERVLIQFALSLGQIQNQHTLAALAQLARTRLNTRWMDNAILCSLNQREVDMLDELLRDPGNSQPLMPHLAQAIAASRNETHLARTLKLLTYATPETQKTILEALSSGRNNAPRTPLQTPEARSSLKWFTSGDNTPVEISAAAKSLLDSFSPNALADETSFSNSSPPANEITEEQFLAFLAGLSQPRDLNRGHQVYAQACAPCHRIGSEGHDVGPDLLGQIGMAEESLLHDILTPSQRIRPGFEMTEALTVDGVIIAGLLKNDGATSITLRQAGGIEQEILRKDIAEIRRTPTSLMPAFTEGYTPADIASLLSWLRHQLNAPRN